MTQIYIRKKNNIYATIHSDDQGALMGLYEHFSRYVKGYQFSPKFKARTWDGKIKFFNRMTGEIYIGIVIKVIEYFKSEGISVTLDPEVVKCFSDSDFDEDDFNQFIANLNPTKPNGESLEWRDYQINAIKTIVSKKRRLIASPTSSGKSLILYSSMRYLTECKDVSKVLIVVPTLALIRQMKSDFTEYSINNGWDAHALVSEYGGGKKETYGVCTVGTWQSLYKHDAEWFSQFDAMFIDEAHEATAASLVDIGKKCNAEYRIGLSGSFNNDDDETTELTLNGIFGNTTSTITTREMIDKGYASEMYIKCVQVKHDEQLQKKIDYQKEIDYLATNVKRNEFICDLADTIEGNTLVIMNLVEKQAKPLHKMMQERTNKKVFFVYGGTDVEDRENIRKLLEKQNDAIIVSTYKCFSTGISVKNLHNIIFASPTKSYRRVIQSIGRGLRLLDGKTHCTLYDLFDHLCGDINDLKKCNHTFIHFLERVKMYNKEEHNFEIIK